MTPKLQAIIDELEKSGSSESYAVGECLRNIAGNGSYMAHNKHLLCCAGEIRDSAQSVLDRMGKRSIQKDLHAALLTLVAEVAPYVNGTRGHYDLRNAYQNAQRVIAKVSR